MSPRDWEERIRDILDAISEIDVFTHGMDFDDFKADTKTMKAVELNLIVIGEAVGKSWTPINSYQLLYTASNLLLKS